MGYIPNGASKSIEMGLFYTTDGANTRNNVRSFAGWIDATDENLLAIITF